MLESMKTETQTDWDLFEGGPPIGLQRRMGLLKAGPLPIASRMWVVILLTWVPLLLLALIQRAIDPSDVLSSFLSDLAAHARFLVAAPLFILAERICSRRLGAIAHHFVDAGLVRDQDRARFEAATASTRRLRESFIVEVLVIAAAYFLVYLLIASVPQEEFPAWHTAGEHRFSWPGWWHTLVSLPLLMVLLLGWIWRLYLWTRFLAHVAAMELHLIPAHPDNAAGLRFVGYSLRACSVLAFALGTIVAGTVANGIHHEGHSLAEYYYAIAGVAVFSLVLFCGPLLLFMPKLLQAWRRGVFDYGALASRFGLEFEQKWFRGRRMDQDTLEVQDFSAATDLYQVVDNVYGMNLIPVDLKSVLLLVVTTLLPFVPVVLLALPLDTILSTLTGLLL